MGHLILLRAARETTVTDAPHLSVDEAASYLDGTLSDDARATIERHLAECDRCREEIAASANLVATMPAPSRRGVPWRLAFPLAAGIVFAMLFVRPGSRPDVAPAERAAVGDASAIALVAPAADAPLVAGRTRLVWRALDDSASYRVVIKDASGDTVWSGETADTVLTVPATVRLIVGERYVWRVDGQRADGTSAASIEASVRASQ